VRRNDGLDAVRLSAEVMVFCSHLAYYGIVTGVFSIVVGLRSGVVLFFVLSGYLLYRPFVLGEANLNAYMIRRFARIVPAYWVALVGTTLLSGDQAFVRDPIPYLVFAQNYSPESFNGFLGVSWTLVLEMIFYAVLPLLAALARRHGAWVLVAFGLLSFLGQIGTWELGPHAGLEYGSLRLVASLFPFVLWCFVPGMLLARFEGHHRLAWTGHSSAALLGLGLLILGVIGNPWSTNNPLAVAGSFLLVAFGVARPGPRLPGWVGYGAAISYAAYLWHVDVMRLFAGWPAAGILAAIATVSVATLSYYVVERPVLALARRRFPRAAPVGELAPVESVP
jgi:peptidoglycan/LPS O-acetylase OafA/YrhL